MESFFEAIELNDVIKVKDWLLANFKGSYSEYIDLLALSINNAQMLNTVFYQCGEEVNEYFINRQPYMLYTAISSGKDIDIVEEILNLDKDSINCVDATWMSPLITAVLHDREISLINFLLENNADANVCESSGKTALHYAKKSEVVKLLIENGADVNRTDNEGLSPLLTAIQNQRDGKVISEFIKNGADLELHNCVGQTCLHLALYLKYEEDVINQICSKTLGYNVEDKKGLTPLHYALDSTCSEKLFGYRYTTDFIYELINKGFVVTANIFMNVVKHCKNIDLVLCLAKNVINVKYVDVHGNCFFHYVYDVRVIKVLARRGAPVNHENNDGITPLMKAITSCKSDEVIESLLFWGADIRKLDNFFDLTKLCLLRISTYDLLITYGMSVSFKKNCIKRYVFFMFRFAAKCGTRQHTIRRLLRHVILSNENIMVPADIATNVNVFNLIKIYCTELNKMKHTILTNDVTYYSFCMKQYRSIRSPFVDEGFTEDDSKNIKKLFQTFFNEVIVKIKINIKIYKRKDLFKKLMYVSLAKKNENGNNFVNVVDSSRENTVLDYDSMYLVGSFMSRLEINCLLAAAIT